MADIKISELPAAGSVADTDQFEVNQSGTSRRATLLQVRGAGTAPFDDATALVKGSADATKLLRIEIDGFATATTRVLTPPNRNWTPTTYGSELTEVAEATAGRTKLGLQALATLATVSNAVIDAGAVTANQIYTGSATSAAAVAGVVDVDFATLGTSVDFLIITDATTVHVDLTTPAARRNVYVYNNASTGVDFDIRDAADVVITPSVPYRYFARLGWSGTNWVAKAVQAALGALEGHVHPVSDVTGGTDGQLMGWGTDDVGVAKDASGFLNPNQAADQDVIDGVGTAVKLFSEAQLKLAAETHGGGGGGGLGDETPDSNTSITVGAADGTHKALTGASAITLSLSQTAAVGVRQAFTPKTVQVITVDPASQARYLVPGDTDASLTKAVTDGVWGTPTGNNVTITSAGGNLTDYAAGDLFQVRNHSTAANNGYYIATGTPTTTSLPSTKIDGTAPASAVSEAVDIDTLQRQANFTLTGYGEFECIQNTGGNAAVWRFDGSSNLPARVDGPITIVELQAYSETSPADTGFGGAESVDFAAGGVVAVTLTSNVSSLAITNWPASGKAGAITFIINHGTGPFTWAHPTGTRHPGGVPPTLSGGASDIDILTYVTRDGGTTPYCFVGGIDFL